MPDQVRHDEKNSRLCSLEYYFSIVRGIRKISDQKKNQISLSSLDLKENMKKILILYAILIPLVLLIGTQNLAAYKRRHWEQLLNTKCCQNCNLNKAPLLRIDLTDADLRGSDLRGANFKQATLYKVLLPDPEMYHGADFSGAMWVDGRICKPGSIGFCKDE